MIMDFELIKNIIAQSAAELCVSEYEIYLSSASSISAEAFENDISALGSSVKRGICLRCNVDGKMGYASTQLFEEEEIRGLMSRAYENARNTEKEDIVGIFEGSASYNKPERAAFTPLTAEEVRALALKIQETTYSESDKVIRGTESGVEAVQTSVRIYNSHGLELANENGINIMYAAAVVNDNAESENAFKMGVYGKDSVKDICKTAVGDALSKIGAGKVKTGRYDIVIDAKPMASLLAAYSSSFTAKAAQMGVSRLAGKEGEKIAADIVNITDDPAREGTFAATYFDAEGVAAYRKSVVENGVLKTLLYNRETAKKAGKETTGNASKAGYASSVETSPYAFCIEAGDKTRDELFAMADGGIYITEVKGLHAGANGVTGDFSVESAGFLIENGKKGAPVKSFTIAGNFFDVLKNVAALGDDLEVRISGGTTTFGSPSIRLRDVSVAGE